MSEYILELKNIVKTFGGVTALNNVQFQLKPGEIHAIMGENGAGKSTLIKVMTGVHKPDSGQIFLNGKEVSFSSTQDSLAVGIAAVYQNSTDFPDLSVTENLFMGQEIKNKFGFYNWDEMHKRAKEMLKNLNDKIDVYRPVVDLSVAEKQIVEIAKALSHNVKILILDEPTSSLTKYETEELYRLVEKLRDRGVSIIIISHRMEDTYRLATRVTIFRDSKYILTEDLDKITEQDLIHHMVGRELDQMYPDKTAEIGEKVIEIDKLSRTGKFKNVSFYARKGEIVALTGLVGAGRTEVVESIFGVFPADSGEIKIDGKKVNIRNTRDGFHHGIGMLPEDRQIEGMFEFLPIVYNVTASSLYKYKKGLVINESAEIDDAVRLCQLMSLKAESIMAPPSSLSGGNQQKVVIAKLLNCGLKILILDEPTKGIDVGAKYQVYEVMNQLAESGVTIIMVSSEMPEVIGVADRIYVMHNGRISGEFNSSEVSQEAIMNSSLGKTKGE